jgi:hypothetical protein
MDREFTTSQDDAPELLAEIEAIRLRAERGPRVRRRRAIVRSNAAADAILGYEEQAPERDMALAERVARSPHEWLAEDGSPLSPEQMPGLRAARNGETHRGVVIRMRSRAAERWLEISAAPFRRPRLAVGAVVSSPRSPTGSAASWSCARARLGFDPQDNAPDIVARFDRGFATRS